MKDRRPPAVRSADDARQFDFGWGTEQELFGDDAHRHVAAHAEPAQTEQLRSVWVRQDDVRDPLIEGEYVETTRPLEDWCLRQDDGGAAIAAGTILEVTETRGAGRAMARELTAERTANVRAVLAAVEQVTEDPPPHSCEPGSLAHGVTCDGCAAEREGGAE